MTTTTLSEPRPDRAQHFQSECESSGDLGATAAAAAGGGGVMEGHSSSRGVGGADYLRPLSASSASEEATTSTSTAGSPSEPQLAIPKKTVGFKKCAELSLDPDETFAPHPPEADKPGCRSLWAPSSQARASDCDTPEAPGGGQEEVEEEEVACGHTTTHTRSRSRKEGRPHQARLEAYEFPPPAAGGATPPPPPCDDSEKEGGDDDEDVDEEEDDDDLITFHSSDAAGCRRSRKIVPGESFSPRARSLSPSTSTSRSPGAKVRRPLALRQLRDPLRRAGHLNSPDSESGLLLNEDRSASGSPRRGSFLLSGFPTRSLSGAPSLSGSFAAIGDMSASQEHMQPSQKSASFIVPVNRFPDQGQ